MREELVIKALLVKIMIDSDRFMNTSPGSMVNNLSSKACNTKYKHQNVKSLKM